MRPSRGPALALGALLAHCDGGQLRATDLDASGLDASTVSDAMVSDAALADRTRADSRAPLDAAGSSDAGPLDTSPPPPTPADAGPSPPVVGMNPVLAGDHPDPHVLRVAGADGIPTYYLTATVDSGDFPVYTSRDLVHWERLPEGLFRRTAAPGSSLALGDHHYCHLWAPEVVELAPSSYMLSFTATRFSSARAACPPYGEDSGVYLAWSASPLGPFADMAHPWEPLPAGGQVSSCPAAVRDAIPRSVDIASDDCQGTFCHHIIRLDSDAFRDPATGRWWLAYSWYTNSPALVPWEHDHHGEHVSLVELDAADPFAVVCDPGVAQVHAIDPHDGSMTAALASSCPRCGEMLSMTRGRFDEEMTRDGWSWGVAEGASLFRRGGLVYLLASGSAWDSAYYECSGQPLPASKSSAGTPPLAGSVGFSSRPADSRSATALPCWDPTASAGITCTIGCATPTAETAETALATCGYHRSSSTIPEESSRVSLPTIRGSPWPSPELLLRGIVAVRDDFAR